MLKSHSFAFVLSLLLAFIQLSCRNNTPPAQQETNVAKIDTTMAVIPDPQDLLEILGGNWQNESDPAEQILITDSLITHLHNGQALQKNIIEIDATCAGGSCTTGDQPDDGWCIVERTPSGDQCMKVLKCDRKILRILPLGVPKTELVFRKL